MPVQSAFRNLAAIGVTLTSLALFTSPSAYADAVRFGLHTGYGRIAFDWDAPVRYSASVVQDKLVVQFDRPLIVDISQAASRLTPYVTSVRIEDGGRIAYFTLKPNVTMKTFTLKNIVVVDLSTAPGFGEQRLATAPSPAQVQLTPVPTVPVPTAPVQSGAATGSSERVPLAELTGPQAPEPAPSTTPTSRPGAQTLVEAVSDWTFRPRAEMGVTYYENKLVKGDIPAQLGVGFADDGISDSETTTDATGDYRSILGLPHRVYAEGTLGLTVSSGPWYGDLYWRTAIKHRTQPTDSSVLITRDTFTPDSPFGPQSATRTTMLLDYESQNRFSRNQFGVTAGRTFWNNLSASVGYRRAKLTSTSDFSRTLTTDIDDYPDSTELPLSGDPVPRGETTVSATTGRTSQTRYSLTTNTPTLGLGYSSALDESSRHVMSAGVGGSYTFAKLRFRQFDGETTNTVLVRDTEDVISTDTVAAQENTSGVTGLSPGGFGFWANIGYQFHATPQLTFSVNGDATRVRYGRSVLGNTGESAGNLQELSLSGRFGVSYAFGPQ